jgi:hypothetical protein
MQAAPLLGHKTQQIPIVVEVLCVVPGKSHKECGAQAPRILGCICSREHSGSPSCHLTGPDGDGHMDKTISVHPARAAHVSWAPSGRAKMLTCSTAT